MAPTLYISTAERHNIAIDAARVSYKAKPTREGSAHTPTPQRTTLLRPTSAHPDADADTDEADTNIRTRHLVLTLTDGGITYDFFGPTKLRTPQLCAFTRRLTIDPSLRADSTAATRIEWRPSRPFTALTPAGGLRRLRELCAPGGGVGGSLQSRGFSSDLARGTLTCKGARGCIRSPLHLDQPLSLFESSDVRFSGLHNGERAASSLLTICAAAATVTPATPSAGWLVAATGAQGLPRWWARWLGERFAHPELESVVSDEMLLVSPPAEGRGALLMRALQRLTAAPLFIEQSPGRAATVARFAAAPGLPRTEATVRVPWRMSLNPRTRILDGVATVGCGVGSGQVAPRMALVAKAATGRISLRWRLALDPGADESPPREASGASTTSQDDGPPPQLPPDDSEPLPTPAPPDEEPPDVAPLALPRRDAPERPILVEGDAAAAVRDLMLGPQPRAAALRAPASSRAAPPPAERLVKKPRRRLRVATMEMRTGANWGERDAKTRGGSAMIVSNRAGVQAEMWGSSRLQSVLPVTEALPPTAITLRVRVPLASSEGLSLKVEQRTELASGGAIKLRGVLPLRSGSKSGGASLRASYTQPI